MDNLEKQCRKLAKEKGINIRKYFGCITVYYTVTITKQSKNFYSWEDVFDWLQTK